jgi:hypothetical protein
MLLSTLAHHSVGSCRTSAGCLLAAGSACVVCQTTQASGMLCTSGSLQRVALLCTTTLPQPHNGRLSLTGTNARLSTTLKFCSENAKQCSLLRMRLYACEAPVCYGFYVASQLYICLIHTMHVSRPCVFLVVTYPVRSLPSAINYTLSYRRQGDTSRDTTATDRQQSSSASGHPNMYVPCYYL